MSITSEIFESGFDLYRFLTDKSKNKSILLKMLLREIRDNLKRLEHRNKPGVNRRKLIDMLENESYLKAVSENFNFNKISKEIIVDKKIQESMPNAVKYSGWNVEQLLNSIDEKIVSLKDLTKLFDNPDEAPVNLTARLNNLYTLLLLLSFSIKKTNV
jgi:hypothetical protein